MLDSCQSLNFFVSSNNDVVGYKYNTFTGEKFKDTEFLEECLGKLLILISATDNTISLDKHQSILIQENPNDKNKIDIKYRKYNSDMDKQKEFLIKASQTFEQFLEENVETTCYNVGDVVEVVNPCMVYRVGTQNIKKGTIGDVVDSYIIGGYEIVIVLSTDGKKFMINSEGLKFV